MIQKGTRHEVLWMFTVLLALSATFAWWSMVWGPPNKFNARQCSRAVTALKDAGVAFPENHSIDESPTWVLHREMLPVYTRCQSLARLNMWVQIGGTVVFGAALSLAGRPKILAGLFIVLAVAAGYTWIEQIGFALKGYESMLSEALLAANQRLLELGADYSALKHPETDAMFMAANSLRPGLVAESPFHVWSSFIVMCGSTLAALITVFIAIRKPNLSPESVSD